LDVRGWVESDFRVRVSDLPAGAWHAPTGIQKGVERFRNRAGGVLVAEGQSWLASVEGEFVLSAKPQAAGLGDLAHRPQVDPFWFELDEAAIEIWDAGVAGLDLKIGHQVVQWGAADQFNPTNTLNPENFEDPLKFGEQLPNTMVRADYSLGPTWTISGVLVPVFRPATLPSTSSIGVSFTDRMPVIQDRVRQDLQAKQALAADLGFPTIVDAVDLDLPPATLNNMAGMIRVGGAIGMTDLALSLYSGRTDMPQAVANDTRLERRSICHPMRPDSCIQGYMVTDSTLAYPRMHVAGLNAAGELDVLSGIGGQPIGWRLEAAWVMPERTTIAIRNTNLDLGGLVQPEGEFAYGLGGERPNVVSDKPYAKWTLGLDYTIGKALYLNAQWVHGMADEFGQGDFIDPDFVTRAGGDGWEIRRLRTGDYVVLGTDINLPRATLRLFSILDVSGYHREDTAEPGSPPSITNFGPFSKNGFSAVLYPELMVSLGDGLNWSVGTIQLFGAEHTKFGDPAAGGDLVFTKVRYDF